MKNIYISLVGIALFSLTLGACEDNLDIAQHGVVSEDEFYKTDADAEEAVTAVYAAWSGSMYDQFFLKNMISDDMWCGGGNRGDNTTNESLNEYTFTSSNTLVKGAFSDYYTIIYRANLVINKFTPESQKKSRAIAEAKFFRAISYFDLVTLWGTPPLITTLLNSETYKQPNAKAADIWTQIEKDLTEAISSGALPQKSSLDDKETGIRVTLQTAQAWLGKALVFEGKWSDAATVLDKVINSGLYDLYEGKYENVLRAVADNGRESMLEVNALNDASNPYNFFTMMNYMIGWRSDRLTSMWSGYGWAHDLLPMGWGFANPTKSLYDAFVAREGVNGTRLNGTLKTYAQVKAISPYAPIAINNGVYLYGHEGLFMWKYRLLGAEAIPNSWSCFFNNQRVTRYAEVLLLAAEANLMAGNTARAKECINKIRQRAGLAALDNITLDDVKAEKRLELCAEGIRFQDLVRWGDAAKALGSRGASVPVFYGFNADNSLNIQYPFTNTEYGFKAGKHELLPFPEAELNVNEKIKQNPNW